MKPLLTSIFVTLFLQAFGQNLQYNWSQQLAGLDEVEVNDMALDNQGNILLTGNFIDTVDFDPGPGVVEKVSNGLFDFFICKLDPTGNLQWVVANGGEHIEVAYDIDVDSHDSIVVVGGYNETVDFDHGAGTYELTTVNNEDAFVLKLGPDGGFAWAESFGAFGGDNAKALVIDSQDRIIVSGNFQGTVDFDNGPDDESLTTFGSSPDVFFLRLTPQGNFSYVRKLTGTGLKVVRRLVLDDTDKVYFIGHFSSTVVYDPGSTLSVSSNGGLDIIVGKLNSLGYLMWFKEFGGNDGDSGFDLTVDAAGNIYAVGHFQFLADFEPGSGTNNLVSNDERDAFVMKLNSSGVVQWVRQFGGAGQDYAEGITLDQSGNAVFTGYFYETCDFDPTAGAMYVTSADGADGYVCSLSPDGVLNWADTYQGTENQFFRRVFVDQNDNVFVCGSFQGLADFDSGTATANLTSAGGKDGFVFSASALTVGMNEASQNNRFRLFPNPASGEFELRFSQNTDYLLEVFDATGRTVYQQIGNGNRAVVDEQLSSGVYYVSLSVDGQVAETTKLIVN